MMTKVATMMLTIACNRADLSLNMSNDIISLLKC